MLDGVDRGYAAGVAAEPVESPTLAIGADMDAARVTEWRGAVLDAMNAAWTAGANDAGHIIPRNGWAAVRQFARRGGRASGAHRRLVERDDRGQITGIVES